MENVMERKEQILNDLRSQPDEVLISLAEDLFNNQTFGENHLLRTIAKNAYGDDHPTATLLQILSLSPFISVVLAERLRSTSPHVNNTPTNNLI